MTQHWHAHYFTSGSHYFKSNSSKFKFSMDRLYDLAEGGGGDEDSDSAGGGRAVPPPPSPQTRQQQQLLLLLKLLMKLRELTFSPPPSAPSLPMGRSKGIISSRRLSPYRDLMYSRSASFAIVISSGC